MSMSLEGVEKMKLELDKHQKTLLKHENKWNVASVVQRLSGHDQSKLLKASVVARTLTVTMIPKLKDKIDTWVTKKEDRLLRDILAEYETVNNKVRWTFEKFKKLESGNGKAIRTQNDERDKALSISIEESLKQRRESKGGPSGSVGMLANTVQTSRSGGNSKGAVSRVKQKTQKPEDLCSPKGVKEQLKGGGDVREAVMDEVKGLWNAEGETQKFMEQLEKILSPEELAWLLQSKESFTEAVANLVGKSDHEDKKTGGKRIEHKIMKWIKERHQNAREPVKVRTKEKSFGLKAVVPHPIPIDSFMNFVESLPGEIRNMVQEQTESLYALGKDRISPRKQLSDRKGRLVSMDKLREEYRDDRFDASDYRIRVPEALIDEEYLKWIKEQKVDDAVERYFGSFKKKEPPELTGDLLDAILEPEFMPKPDKTQSPDEDPEELLGKHHMKRVSLLQKQDFKIDEESM